MDPITDYVLAIIDAYPTVRTLRIGQGAIGALDVTRLPAGVSAVEFGEDYCAGADEEGEQIVTFRV